MICGHWVGETYVLLRLIKIGSFLNIFRSETFLCSCLWIVISSLFFISKINLTLEWPRGVLGTQHLFFAHFTTFACEFLTVIFSNCFAIGYASFDAKKFWIDLVIFSLIRINEHYCAVLKKNVLFAILKRNIFKMLFQECKSIHVFLFWTKFHWASVFFLVFFGFFFSNFGQIEMMRNKNRLFGRHFEMVQYFICFSRIMILYSSYIFGPLPGTQHHWRILFMYMALAEWTMLTIRKYILFLMMILTALYLFLTIWSAIFLCSCIWNVECLTSACVELSNSCSIQIILKDSFVYISFLTCSVTVFCISYMYCFLFMCLEILM